MAFKFTLQTETVEFPGGEIAVRGLSFPDLAKLVDVNRETLIPLFDKYSGRAPEKLVLEDSSAIILDVLTAAPSAVAHIISMAADAEDQFNQIVQIPVGAQIEIIAKIGELTFKTSGGAKNLAAIVKNLVQVAVADKTKNPRV
jgi:hypothetical protein